MMFTNFVLEFQACFSDIMSTEELIERIKKNIVGNIIIIDEFDNKDLDGRYDEEGYVYLKKSAIKDDRYVRYLLFHEMLHAITATRDENGKKRMQGFVDKKNGYGNGLDEAMTEYLTQIRNEVIEGDSSDLISGFRTIVEQMRRLVSIVGEENLKKCYFYNPEGLKELLNSNGMDYEELELAYRELRGEDGDVWLIENGKKIEHNENYKIHRFAEMIFNNYANAIGEVNSLEDFIKKYEIFQTYVDGEYDCITIMLVAYCRNIGNDVERLLKKGVSIDSIKSVLQVLGIDLSAFKKMYNFSKCFVDDKNESAVRIYEYCKENSDLYIEFFAQNYGIRSF